MIAGYLQLRRLVINKAHTVISKYQFVPETKIDSQCLDTSVTDYVVPDPQQEYLQQLNSQLDKALEVSRALGSGFMVFSNVFREAAESLQETDESFFFIGGWHRHAVIYEVIHNEKGLYDFRIYNIGSGSEFNVNLPLPSGYSLSRPYVTYKDLNPEKLFDNLFVYNLFSINKLPGKGQADFLHNSLSGYLSAQRCYNPNNLDELVKLQFSGTCGYITMPLQQKHWSRVFLKNDKSAKQKSELLEDWINFYYIQYAAWRLSEYDEDKIQVSDHEVQESSIRYFMENLLRRQRVRASDQGMLVYTADRLIEWRNILSGKKNNDPVVKGSGETIQASEKDIWPELDKRNPYNLDTPKDQATVRRIGRFYNMINNWQPEQGDALERLQRIVNILKSWKFDDSMVYQPQYRRAMEALIGVRLFVEKMPLSCIGSLCPEDMYLGGNKTTTEGLTRFLRLLKELSDEYFWAMQVAFRYHNYNPLTEDMLTQVRIFTLADVATTWFLENTEIPRLKGLKMKLRPDWFGHFTDNYINAPSFPNKSESVYSQFVEVKKYWGQDEKKQGENFFALGADYYHIRYVVFHGEIKEHIGHLARSSYETWHPHNGFRFQEMNFLASYEDSFVNTVRNEIAPGERIVNLVLNAMAGSIEYRPGVSDEDKVPEFYYLSSPTIAFSNCQTASSGLQAEKYMFSIARLLTVKTE